MASVGRACLALTLSVVARAADGQTLEAVVLFRQVQACLLRDLFHPYRALPAEPGWLTSDAVALARAGVPQEKWTQG